MRRLLLGCALVMSGVGRWQTRQDRAFRWWRMRAHQRVDMTIDGQTLYFVCVAFDAEEAGAVSADCGGWCDGDARVSAGSARWRAGGSSASRGDVVQLRQCGRVRLLEQLGCDQAGGRGEDGDDPSREDRLCEERCEGRAWWSSRCGRRARAEDVLKQTTKYVFWQKSDARYDRY